MSAAVSSTVDWCAVTDAIATSIADRGLSVRQISEKCGIPRSTMQRRLTGDGAGSFGIADLGRLVVALDVDVLDYVAMIGLGNA